MGALHEMDRRLEEERQRVIAQKEQDKAKRKAKEEAAKAQGKSSLF
jgi:hypothetical protein